MKMVLLDTHVFLWAVAAPERMPAEAWPILRDPNVQLRLSVASAWELTIKVSAGKLTLPSSVGAFVSEGCRQLDAELVGIQVTHLDALCTLPHLHRDPFDRLMVAQAIADRMVFLTFDKVLDGYEVERLP